MDFLDQNFASVDRAAFAGFLPTSNFSNADGGCGCGCGGKCKGDSGFSNFAWPYWPGGGTTAAPKPKSKTCPAGYTLSWLSYPPPAQWICDPGPAVW